MDVSCGSYLGFAAQPDAELVQQNERPATGGQNGSLFVTDRRTECRNRIRVTVLGQMVQREWSLDDDQREERFQRTLTQRELVRASLLRCPPQEEAEPPRH